MYLEIIGTVVLLHYTTIFLIHLYSKSVRIKNVFILRIHFSIILNFIYLFHKNLS